MYSGKVSLYVILSALFSVFVSSAAILENVRGIVHDPDHRPVAAASVTLRSHTSDYKQSTQTGADGAFAFQAVPIGEYTIEVSRDGFATAEEPLVVASGSLPILHIQLKLAAHAETVEVSENLDGVNPESSTTSTLVDRRDIAQTPGADQTNSLAMITSFVPGAYMAHDQLHVRGGHQVSWLIDGVPVPNTNIASNVGPQFDPNDIDYLEVQRGGYSAEYGDRTYGVFNVVPRTGFERNGDGELVMSYGQFNQTNDDISFGDHTQRLAWYASVNGNRSDLGLETPGPGVLHDRTGGVGGFGSLIFNVDPTDQLRLVTSIRRDDYQIPNTPEEQAAGMNDLDRERDSFVNFSWVRTIGAGLLFTVSPFYHYNQANYVGGPNDPLLSTQDSLTSQYGGAQATVSAASRRNSFRAGIYGFGQQDNRAIALTATDGSGLSVGQHVTPSGNLEALFVDDQFKAASWLTLNGGLHLTHFGGGVSENAADPRAGAAISLPRIHWVLRGFFGRYYQAPPLSTVAGPIAEYAVEQGLGILPLHGERDEENQFGLTIPLHGWTLDSDHFHTHTRNYFDHDSIGNSNVFLPLTIAAARVDGWEVTLRSPLLYRRGQFHLAYSSQVAQGAGAVTGGLTDFSPPAGYFPLDHDQRHTLSFGGYTALPGHARFSGDVYYGSGFPDNGGPARLPGHITVDTSLGRDFGKNWTVSLVGLNVGNRRALLDNSPTFGGTHYLDPRQLYCEVRYRFHLR